MSVLKVNADNLILGSAFIGLILGLASQSALSNLFAGIMIILSKPVEPGDVVTINTWQFPVTYPIYRPKFYSKNSITVGQTGIVYDVGLLYTTIKDEERKLIKIPNGILIQALVINHSKAEKNVVHLSYDVKNKVDPDRLIKALNKAISKSGIFYRGGKQSILISETDRGYYSISISLEAKTDRDAAKSELIKMVMKTAKRLGN